ncbi:MAG: hypothetical protein KGQ49_00110, partial [Verrucomicrobia bacterium]|nr:hypothetical protein [Verrucomicrobiota bacterium]
STGALQTVLLTIPGKDNQPKYTAKDVLAIYDHDGRDIFYNPWYHRLLTLNGALGPKYKTTARYRLFEKYLDGLYFDQLINNIVIPAYDLATGTPDLFINWNEPGQDTNFAIANLLMGAVSPPGLFPGVTFGTHNQRFILIDGGIFANNPNLAAALIGMSIYPNKKYILVSIGTGWVDNPSPSTSKVVSWGELQWSGDLLTTIFTSNAKFNTLLVQNMFPIPLDLYSLNTKVSGLDATLDNISGWNIDRLNREGKRMVEENQEVLDQLISRLLSP